MNDHEHRGPPPNEDKESHERELNDLLSHYVERLNCGESLDHDSILEEHPDLGPDILRELETYIEFDLHHEAAEPLGTLGDYTLRRQIGRGGMGVVYEAWENSMDRAVALKVLPGAVAADDKSVTRFVREARLAGKLNHPNVVGVHGMGVKDQTPYYAMEFVEGETLAQVLAKIKDADPGTDTPLGSKDEVAYFGNLAKAFADVAEGLQHAHSKGVTHRDIKPSNLILDRDGRLRILDFGLARLEGQESLTLSGDFIGTPLYMSPEQAQRKKIPVDHRTDIYSLGATLYETVAGRPPFRGRDHADTLSQIVERDAVEPRKFNPRVPKDLETIVSKCLRKDAADRYGTAEALAQDLRRMARGDPVEARPQAGLEKLVRRLRKHRARLVVSAVALFIVVLASAVSTLLIWNAKQDTESALTAERQAKDELQVVYDYVVKEMLGSAAPESTLGKPLTVAEVLDTAAGRVDTLKGQPRIEAAVRSLIGYTYSQLGHYEEAERQLFKAHEIGVAVAGPDEPSVVRTLQRLGVVYHRQGRYDEAWEAFQTCIDTAKRPGHENDPVALDAMTMMAGVLIAKGKKQESLDQSRRVLAILRKRPAGEKDTRELLVMENLAATLESLNRLEEARDLYDQIIELRKDLSGPEHPLTLKTLSNYAFLLEKEGKLEEAINLSEKVLASARKVLGEENTLTLQSMNNLGVLLRKQGHLEEAREIHEKALELQTRHLGRRHFLTLHSMLNVALDLQKEPEKARQLFQEAEAIAVEELGEHPLTFSLKRHLANSLIRSKEFEPAEKLLKEALLGRRKVLGDKRAETADVVADLGRLYRLMGKHEEASRFCKRAVELRREVLGPEHRHTLHSMCHLAVSLMKTGALEASRRQADESFETCFRVLGAEDWLTSSALNSWMFAVEKRAVGGELRGTERIQWLRGALERLEKWSPRAEKLPKLCTFLASVCNNLAWYLVVTPEVSDRKPGEAVRLAQRAVKLASRKELELSGQLGTYLGTLGACHLAAHEWQKAIDAFEKGMPLRGGGDSYEWFGLAVAHARLGNQPAAQKWYARGVRWMEEQAGLLEKQPTMAEELQRFRREAAELLDSETRKEQP